MLTCGILASSPIMVGPHHGWPPSWLAPIMVGPHHGWPPSRLSPIMVGHHHGWPPSWLATIMVGPHHGWSPSWFAPIMVGPHHGWLCLFKQKKPLMLERARVKVSNGQYCGLVLPKCKYQLLNVLCVAGYEYIPVIILFQLLHLMKF